MATESEMNETSESTGSRVSLNLWTKAKDNNIPQSVFAGTLTWLIIEVSPQLLRYGFTETFYILTDYFMSKVTLYVFTFGTGISVLWALMTVVIGFFYARVKAIGEEPDNPYLTSGMFSNFFLVLFVVSFFIMLTDLAAQVEGQRVQNRFIAVKPYTSDSLHTRLKSDMVRVKTYKEFQAVNAKLDSIAQANGIDLPEAVLD